MKKFVQGQGATFVSKLEQKLQSEKLESNIAILNYEIYKINKSTEHKEKALESYKKSYAKTPNYEYWKRITELNEV